MSNLIKILKDWKECIDILDNNRCVFIISPNSLLGAVKQDEQHYRYHAKEILKKLDKNHLITCSNKNKQLIEYFTNRTEFNYEH